jgi:hypothetical protein
VLLAIRAESPPCTGISTNDNSHLLDRGCRTLSSIHGILLRWIRVWAHCSHCYLLNGNTIVETASKVFTGSSPDRPQKDALKSRVTNGSALLPGIDGRSAWVRRCKDVIASHISDLGGVDNCSAAERSIIRRAAVLTTELEQLEARFATAGQADAGDLETYQRCANSLRRLLEAVGLQRRARDVTPPTLDEIAAEIEAEKHSADEMGHDAPHYGDALVHARKLGSAQGRRR